LPIDIDVKDIIALVVFVTGIWLSLQRVKDKFSSINTFVEEQCEVNESLGKSIHALELNQIHLTTLIKTHLEDAKN